MIRRLAGLATAGLFVCAAAAAEQKGSKVSYPSGSETESGNLWAPGGSEKKPALVVIHEGWGLNVGVITWKTGMYRRSYVTLAPHLYRGKLTGGAEGAPQLR